MYVCMCVCVYMCIYVCVYVYVHIYIYIYMYTHTYIHMHTVKQRCETKPRRGRRGASQASRGTNQHDTAGMPVPTYKPA